MTTSRPLPPEAAAELLRRRHARGRLLPFTAYTYPQYRAERAHALIAEHLDAVVRGETGRLMIFAPPQHGKSELASVRLPAFWLGKHPEDPVILASYGASLAESKSRQARQVVEGPEYRRLFPGIATRRDSRAVDHWHLDGHRGGMLVVGVGGPITGHGALLGVIDDPFENWEQAQSETIREKIWDWWRTTFRTRIWEGGAIVLIMTRWHEDDLAGRLLAEQAGAWRVLRLPALAETQAERDATDERLGLPSGQSDPLGREPGEPLCPERFSLGSLQDLQRDVGSMGWAGQYQGTPRAPEGNRFKRAWFPIVEAGPAAGERVRYWDKAGTDGAGAFTVGLLMARGPDHLYYVADVVRGQWSAGPRDEVMRQTAQLDRTRYGGRVAIWVEQEPGSGGKESAEASIRLLAGFPVYAERVTDPKEVRAEPFAAQAEAGNVRLVRGPWNGPYIEEMISFPAGTYRDQVDATSGAFNKLVKAKGGSSPGLAFSPGPQTYNPYGR
jgi:predicted phage terminase large subunit-like protein